MDCCQFCGKAVPTVFTGKFCSPECVLKQANRERFWSQLRVMDMIEAASTP